MSRRPLALAALVALSACAQVLDLPDRQEGGAIDCASGTCVCQDGFANCDGLAGNGCEASLLDDPTNCGMCGVDCQGGACSEGLCGAATLTKASIPDADGILLQGGFVFAATDRGLVRVDAAGGGVVDTIVAGDIVAKHAARDLKRLGGYLYWTAGDVYRIDLTSGASEIVATNHTGAEFSLVAPVHGAVYFTGNDGVGPVLRRKPLDGADEIIAYANTMSRYVALATSTDGASAIVASTCCVRRIDGAGADDKVTLASNRTPTSLLVIGDDVYFTNDAGGIDKVPVDGHAAPTRVSTTPTGAGSLAADEDGALYFAAGGTILRAGSLGEAATPVVSTTSEIKHLVATRAALYWSTGDAIERVTLPAAP